MSRLDEIETLEKTIHESLKAMTEKQYGKKKALENIIKIRAAIEGSLVKVTLHSGNKTHAEKRETDFVDFNEYAKTLKHLESATITLEDARVLLATAESSVKIFDQDLASLQADLDTAKLKLSRYGQVIEVDFPLKAAA